MLDRLGSRVACSRIAPDSSARIPAAVPERSAARRAQAAIPPLSMFVTNTHTTDPMVRYALPPTPAFGGAFMAGARQAADSIGRPRTCVLPSVQPATPPLLPASFAVCAAASA
jgi:hypothetical protein